MSRPARAGSAGRPVTFRATEQERYRWEQLAGLTGEPLSEWIRIRLNEHADKFEARFAVKLKTNRAARRAERSRR